MTCRVTTEAETGGMWPQAKEHLGPPGAGGAGRTLPQSLQRGPGPVDTVAAGSCWLQNWETTSLHF